MRTMEVFLLVMKSRKILLGDPANNIEIYQKVTSHVCHVTLYIATLYRTYGIVLKRRRILEKEGEHSKISKRKDISTPLDRLVKWSEKLQMLFNFWKCKCLHTGQGNLDVNYKMGDTVLGTTVKEKDLGVTISADLKVSEQCGIAASNGNQLLGLIRRNTT